MVTTYMGPPDRDSSFALQFKLVEDAFDPGDVGEAERLVSRYVVAHGGRGIDAGDLGADVPDRVMAAYKLLSTMRGRAVRRARARRSRKGIVEADADGDDNENGGEDDDFGCDLDDGGDDDWGTEEGEVPEGAHQDMDLDTLATADKTESRDNGDDEGHQYDRVDQLRSSNLQANRLAGNILARQQHEASARQSRFTSSFGLGLRKLDNPVPRALVRTKLTFPIRTKPWGPGDKNWRYHVIGPQSMSVDGGPPLMRGEPSRPLVNGRVRPNAAAALGFNNPWRKWEKWYHVDMAPGDGPLPPAGTLWRYVGARQARRGGGSLVWKVSKRVFLKIIVTEQPNHPVIHLPAMYRSPEDWAIDDGPAEDNRGNSTGQKMENQLQEEQQQREIWVPTDIRALTRGAVIAQYNRKINNHMNDVHNPLVVKMNYRSGHFADLLRPFFDDGNGASFKDNKNDMTTRTNVVWPHDPDHLSVVGGNDARFVMENFVLEQLDMTGSSHFKRLHSRPFLADSLVISRNIPDGTLRENPPQSLLGLWRMARCLFKSICVLEHGSENMRTEVEEWTPIVLLDVGPDTVTVQENDHTHSCGTHRCYKVCALDLAFQWSQDKGQGTEQREIELEMARLASLGRNDNKLPEQNTIYMNAQTPVQYRVKQALPDYGFKSNLYWMGRLLWDGAPENVRTAMMAHDNHPNGAAILSDFNRKHAAGEYVHPLPELASYRLMTMIRKLCESEPADRPTLIEVEREITYGLREAGDEHIAGKPEPWEEELWRKRAKRIIEIENSHGGQWKMMDATSYRKPGPGRIEKFVPDEPAIKPGQDEPVELERGLQAPCMDDPEVPDTHPETDRAYLNPDGDNGCRGLQNTPTGGPQPGGPQYGRGISTSTAQHGATTTTMATMTATTNVRVQGDHSTTVQVNEGLQGASNQHELGTPISSPTPPMGSSKAGRSSMDHTWNPSSPSSTPPGMSRPNTPDIKATQPTGDLLYPRLPTPYSGMGTPGSSRMLPISTPGKPSHPTTPATSRISPAVAAYPGTSSMPVPSSRTPWPNPGTSGTSRASLSTPAHVSSLQPPAVMPDRGSARQTPVPVAKGHPDYCRTMSREWSATSTTKNMQQPMRTQEDVQMRDSVSSWQRVSQQNDGQGVSHPQQQGQQYHGGRGQGSRKHARGDGSRDSGGSSSTRQAGGNSTGPPEREGGIRHLGGDRDRQQPEIAPAVPTHMHQEIQSPSTESPGSPCGTITWTASRRCDLLGIRCGSSDCPGCSRTSSNASGMWRTYRKEHEDGRLEKGVRLYCRPNQEAGRTGGAHGDHRSRSRGGPGSGGPSSPGPGPDNSSGDPGLRPDDGPRRGAPDGGPGPDPRRVRATSPSSLSERRTSRTGQIGSHWGGSSSWTTPQNPASNQSNFLHPNVVSARPPHTGPSLAHGRMEMLAENEQLRLREAKDASHVNMSDSEDTLSAHAFAREKSGQEDSSSARPDGSGSASTAPAVARGRGVVPDDGRVDYGDGLVLPARMAGIDVGPGVKSNFPEDHDGDGFEDDESEEMETEASRDATTLGAQRRQEPADGRAQKSSEQEQNNREHRENATRSQRQKATERSRKGGQDITAGQTQRELEQAAAAAHLRGLLEEGAGAARGEGETAGEQRAVAAHGRRRQRNATRRRDTEAQAEAEQVDADARLRVQEDEARRKVLEKRRQQNDERRVEAQRRRLAEEELRMRLREEEAASGRARTTRSMTRAREANDDISRGSKRDTSNEVKAQRQLQQTQIGRRPRRQKKQDFDGEEETKPPADPEKIPAASVAIAARDSIAWRWEQWRRNFASMHGGRPCAGQTYEQWNHMIEVSGRLWYAENFIIAFNRIKRRWEVEIAAGRREGWPAEMVQSDQQEFDLYHNQLDQETQRRAAVREDHLAHEGKERRTIDAGKYDGNHGDPDTISGPALAFDRSIQQHMEEYDRMVQMRDADGPGEIWTELENVNPDGQPAPGRFADPFESENHYEDGDDGDNNDDDDDEEDGDQPESRVFMLRTPTKSQSRSRGRSRPVSHTRAASGASSRSRSLSHRLQSSGKTEDAVSDEEMLDVEPTYYNYEHVLPAAKTRPSEPATPNTRPGSSMRDLMTSLKKRPSATVLCDALGPSIKSGIRKRSASPLKTTAGRLRTPSASPTKRVGGSISPVKRSATPTTTGKGAVSPIKAVTSAAYPARAARRVQQPVSSPAKESAPVRMEVDGDEGAAHAPTTPSKGGRPRRSELPVRSNSNTGTPAKKRADEETAGRVTRSGSVRSKD